MAHLNILQPYVRDASVLQRAGAMSALDRLKLMELKVTIEESIHNMVILVHTNPGNISFFNLGLSLIASFACVMHYAIMLIPRKVFRKDLVRKYKRIDSYDEYPTCQSFSTDRVTITF